MMNFQFSLKKVSIHTASRIDTQLAVARVSRVRLRIRVGVGLGLVGLGLASQATEASCVYLPGMAIHTATGEASHVYSI